MAGAAASDDPTAQTVTRRRAALALMALPSLAIMPVTPSRADSSSRDLASYYERHMALVDGVAYGWVGRGAPQRLLADVTQAGVGKDRWYALLQDATLVRWRDGEPAPSVPAMRGVAAFASGDSGWFAIDRDGVLWHSATADAPRRIADGVRAACVGDGADYYVANDGRLFVSGLAHRGQYGDGRLTQSSGFVATAADAVAVRAHTGHAIYLARDGAVWGTGGNRFGPLSSHGLGDKADRWGRIFDGAVAIATGSRHSAAIRADGSLWVWGEGFAIAPRQAMDGVTAVAAGDTATIARRADGTLWQWDGGTGPRRLALP